MNRFAIRAVVVIQLMMMCVAGTTTRLPLACARMSCSTSSLQLLGRAVRSAHSSKKPKRKAKTVDPPFGTIIIHNTIGSIIYAIIYKKVKRIVAIKKGFTSRMTIDMSTTTSGARARGPWRLHCALDLHHPRPSYKAVQWRRGS